MRSPLLFETAALAALDARSAILSDRLNALPTLDVSGLSRHPLVAAEIVGRPAVARWTLPGDVERLFSGVVTRLESLEGHASWMGVAGGGVRGRVDAYRVEIAPWFWVATRTSDLRIFQRVSEVELARRILEEYGVSVATRLDPGRHPVREVRVQHGESDHDFCARMLEQAGVAMRWEGDAVVLDDAPWTPSPTRELRWVDRIPRGAVAVGRLELRRGLRPGTWTARDHDLRLRRSVGLWSTASVEGAESGLERTHYRPGGFVVEVPPPGDTPVADDRGAFRTRPDEGKALAERRLDAQRGDAVLLRFVTTDYSVRTGHVISIVGHPDGAVTDRHWLVVGTRLSGAGDDDAVLQCDAVPTTTRWRPPLRTSRPRVAGTLTATVVGPPGEEIHTDEHGRVRVRFPWDRESAWDDSASPWLPVNQPWAGRGYGGINIPRVGQEVLVNFFEGDPDRPYVVGRVYSAQQRVPYKLPANKTQSGWRSSSTNRTGGFNQLQFEDTSGREQLNVRAQRNRSTTVLRDERITVEGYRSVDVGASDVLQVTGRKYLRVCGARTTFAGGKGIFGATKEFTYEVEQGQFKATATEELSVRAPVIRFKGGPTYVKTPELVVKSGASSITFRGDVITVEAPEVEINVKKPGDVPIPPDHPELEAVDVPAARGGKGGGVGGGGRKKRGARGVSAQERAPRIRTAREELPDRITSTEARPFDEPDGDADVRGELSQPALESWLPPVGAVPQLPLDAPLLPTDRVRGPSALDGLIPRGDSAAVRWRELLDATPGELADSLGVPTDRVEELVSIAEGAARAAGLTPPGGASPLERMRGALEVLGVHEGADIPEALAEALGALGGGTKP